MCKSNKYKIVDLKFIIILAMLFAIFEALSIEFNNYFSSWNLLGYQFQLNISVVFFCLGFFVIDLVTEVYDTTVADFFIYTKMISQVVFISLGNVAVHLSGLESGQLTTSFSAAPLILLYSLLASLIGYKITSLIMQNLKIKFSGRFLFTRYISSTIPGEITFSLVFSLLAFSKGRALNETLNIFLDLIMIKFILSTLFGFIMTPLTNIIRHVLNRPCEYDSLQDLKID